MVVFKQMIDVLNIIKSQSYYSTTYDSSYDRLIELGFLCLEPERNLITVSKNFIKKYEKK